MEGNVSRLDQIQEEVQEIADVLLREHPVGTPMSAVWDKALTLHRVRYETQVLPPPKPDRQRGPK
jgi:hypothetical protein